MLDKPLDEITKSDLQWLIDNKISESIHLEYKSELKVKTNSDKKELCKDVSAMANSFGGRIIFGISEKEQKEDGSIPEELQPIKDKSLKETMQQVLADGVLPRMDFRIQPVPDDDEDGEYIIVEVPQSISGPHFVCYKKENRFYKRRDYEAKPMDQREIEDAYRNFFFQEQKLDNIYEKIKQENPNKDFDPPKDAYCFIYFIPQYPVHNLFHRKYNHITLSDELKELKENYLGPYKAKYTNSYEGFTYHYFITESANKDRLGFTYRKDIFFRNGAVLVSFRLFSGKKKNEKDIFDLVMLANSFSTVYGKIANLYRKCGYSGNIQILTDIKDTISYSLHLHDRLMMLPKENKIDDGKFTHKFITNISSLIDNPKSSSLKPIIPFAQCLGYPDVSIDSFLKKGGYNTTVKEFYQRKAKE